MEKVIQLGNYIETKNRDNPQRGRVYSSYGLCPSIYGYGGGNLQPCVVEVYNEDNNSMQVL